MWSVIIAVGVNLIVYGLNLWTRPKSPAPTPRTRDSLDLPRTEEGTAIPIVFGRCQVKSPVLTWVGDLNTKRGPDDKWITYGLHMLFVIGVPMGNGTPRSNQLNGPLLFNVWMGDKRLPSPGPLPQVGWNTTAIYNQMFVGQPSWLGGPGNGGGLIGTYQWFGGWTDQSFISPASRIGDAMFNKGIPIGRIPGHRKMMCVAFSGAPADSTDPYFSQTYLFGQDHSAYPVPDGFVLGENPSPNGFAFEVSAYGDKVFSMVTPGTDFGGDADPAEVIYDILTNPWSRLGLDTSKIDLTSFAAASATLKAENHGYSNVHYQSEDAHDVITGILQQIDATLYWEPTTAKFVLNLIRFDYNPALIPSFDASNILEVASYSMGSWRETINEVRVKYTDRKQQYNTATVVAQSQANAVGNSNRRRPKEISYPGCTSQKLATQLAGRDLNVLSTPLAKISMTVNRDGWMLRPGQVMKVTYPEYGLVNVVFRVAHVDLGQLHDNKVTIEAVQDAFVSTYIGQRDPTTPVEIVPTPLPQRTVIEVPNWLQSAAFQVGTLNDVDVTRIMALPVRGANETEFYVNSQMVDSTKVQTSWNNLLIDVPRQPFPVTLQVASSYSRVLAPYDTGTGLVVNNLQNGIAASLLAGSATFDQISRYGRNLILAVKSNGDHEIMAYESVTSLGGGSYRLNNVWRGLLDTVPMDHAVGEYVFLLHAGLIGRKSWRVTQQIQVQTVPANRAITGSGADPIDDFPTVGPKLAYDIATPNNIRTRLARSYRPTAPANVAVVGDGCYGATGIPAIASNLKSVSLLEEDFHLYGVKREQFRLSISRGDATDDTMNPNIGTTRWLALAAPAGQMLPAWADSTIVPLFTNVGPGPGLADLLNTRYLSGAQCTIDWYGLVDVGMATQIAVVPANPAVSKGGFESGDFIDSYQVAAVNCFAPSWRNLLANPRFAENVSNGNIGFILSPWFSVQGYQRVTGGSLTGTYISAVAASTAYATTQSVKASTWQYRGLTMIGVGYSANGNGDTNDIARLDVSDSITTVTGTATAPSASHWQRIATSMTLGTGTFPQITLSGTEVSGGGGTTTADIVWSETELRIGQFQHNVLTNYSFETGTTTGWTNILGSMTVPASTGPSGFCAQGGSFATSQIRQEYTLPSGWEANAQAFVTVFLVQTLTGDTATVTVSAVDAGGAVLATGSVSTTGVTPFWIKRTTFCDIPEGTTKVRVDLTAVRVAGAGASTAFFDEVVLWIAKDMAPRSRVLLDFAAPTVQPTPNTIQDFYLAYPTLPMPDYVFGGTTANDEEIVWTDQSMRSPGKFTGQFGGVTYQPSSRRTLAKSFGTSSIDAYTFTRASGAAATHLAAVHQGYLIGAYGLTQSFSVGILYTIDETTFAGRCGLIGRMDLAQGWGLELDVTGHLTAVLRGAGGTSAFITLGRVSTEGGRHWAWLVYDAAAHTLGVYDEIGGTTTSTVTVGEILGTGPACHLRIGRDADDADVMPGMIARAYLFNTALTTGQIAGICTYAEDPNGMISTYTRANAAWHTVPSDTLGEVLTCSGPTQIAIPWSSTLAQVDSFNTDNATFPSPPWVQTYKQTGHGLAVGRSSANRIPSWDFSNATVWIPDASTTLFQGVVDATGRARGVSVVGNATNGIKVVNVAVGAVARNVTLSFWTRGTVGTNNLTVELLTSAGALVTSTTLSLTGLWKRYDIVLAFSGATATCQWRFRPTSTTLGFDLTSVVHSSEWSTTTAFVPALIANPGSTTGDVSATINTTLPAMFNKEGEIVATFTAMRDPDSTLSPLLGTLIRVNNGSNIKNARELQVKNLNQLLFAHTDGAASPTSTASTLAPPSSTLTGVVVKGRGRWNSLALLEPGTTLYSSVAANDSAHSTISYGAAGRLATWTNDTTPSTVITLGAGTAPCDPVLLTYAAIQSREEKLP
jgi:hypothetical protein